MLKPNKASKNRGSGSIALFAAAMALASSCSAAFIESWRPKFYEGLEALAEVKTVPKGYDGERACVMLRHVSGALKFGAEAEVKAGLPGRVKWTVRARAACEGGAEIAPAMEFFRADGTSLGEKTARGTKAEPWSSLSWTFYAPANAASATLRMLSLAGGTVRFARVEAVAEAAGDEDEIPLEVRALPARPNKDWTGLAQETFTSFAGAPLPLSFAFRGDRSLLKAPTFEIDIPEGVVFREAFLEHPNCYTAESPTSRTKMMRNGKPYERLRFDRLQVFKIIHTGYAWQRKLAVYLSSDRTGSHEIFYRVGDGKLRGAETSVAVTFAVLPKGLRAPANFPIFSWGFCELLCSRDDVMGETAAAYETAGLTMAAWPATCARTFELRALLSARGTGWRFPYCLSDFYGRESFSAFREEFAALNAPSPVEDGGRVRRGQICPEFFRSNAALAALMRKIVAKRLAAQKLAKGEWVMLDIEPWSSSHWCVCPLCLEAFRKFAGLAAAPKPGEQCKGELREKWIEFRLGQTEDATRLTCEAIRAFDPTLKIVDYDYVVEYGAPDERVLYGGCAKSSERNEKWFDIHQASYYHILGEKSFRMMRNNTRHLKKPYCPVVAIDGAGGYLNKKEVRTPRQVEQFALAAFVNGCCGMAVYSGRHYDGAFLLAFARARDAMAAVETFPWGRADGALRGAAAGPDFQFATACADGREAIALFNYGAAAPIMARVTHPAGGAWRAINAVTDKTVAERADLGAGLEVDVPAEGVRLLVFEKKGTR